MFLGDASPKSEVDEMDDCRFVLFCKIEGNGTVRNSNNSLLGKVEGDGTVRDSNNHAIGYARGVPMRYAAVYFFFHFM